MIDISSALAGGSDATATGRRCKFGKFLDALPGDQRAEILRRLESPDWTQGRLAKLISGTAFGAISQASLSNHHRAVCPCDTTTETEAA